LLSRIQGIRATADVARTQTVRSPTFSYLYDQVRRTCELCSGVGFDAVLYLANELQRILEGALESSYTFSDHDYRRFTKTLNELLSEAGGDSDRTPDQEPPATPRGAPHDRLVCLLRPEGVAVRQLRSELSYYGIDTAPVWNTDELSRFVRDSSSTVVTVEATAFCDDPALAGELSRIRGELRSRLRIIVVAEEDTFENRLLGVRAGGDAFSSLPVELSSFMSRIDSLSAGGAREPYHVLVVDDSPQEVADIALILQQAGMVTSVVSEADQVFSVLIETKPDLIIMSAELVGCRGTELAAVIRQQEAFVAVPILFLSSDDDQESSIDAIRVAGDEIMVKPVDPHLLVRSVALRLERFRDMRYFMERDSLTGLLNHTNLKESLATEIQRAHRIGTSVSFAMVDIDHFKQVNDTYGHLMGDRVLRSLAWLLQERLRKTDTIGRYGGEEFGIVFFNTDVHNCVATMNRIRESFGRIHHQVSEHEFSVTFSCGVAAFPEHRTAGALTLAADRALYAAKQNGRNRVVSL
jgi:diguanylate cyclase (GGDEF)-like protein